MFKSTRFYSPSKGRMSFNAVIDEIVAIMQEDPEEEYELVVGTDSRSNSGPAEFDFVTAVIIHKVGKGGRYFWKRSREKHIHSLRQKIYKEATLSFELARAVMEELEQRTPLNYNLEIHVDVGQHGKSREIIDEVVGYIRGSGFNVKTKPEAYGASCVADKHV